MGIDNSPFAPSALKYTTSVLDALNNPFSSHIIQSFNSSGEIATFPYLYAGLAIALSL